VAPAPTDALVQLLFVTTELARMVPTAKPVPPLETAAPAIALTVFAAILLALESARLVVLPKNTKVLMGRVAL